MGLRHPVLNVLYQTSYCYRVAKQARRPYLAVCCSVLQCAAAWCSVLQCVAVCCSVLQCVVMCCRCVAGASIEKAERECMLQCAAVCCSVLQCVAVCCSVLQCVAMCCSVLQCGFITLFAVVIDILQHTATHCSTLQHTATHCTTLQHTAPHCNTLHHTAPQCNTLQHTVYVHSVCTHRCTDLYASVSARLNTYFFFLFTAELPDFRIPFYLSSSTNMKNLFRRIKYFNIWSSAQDSAVLELLLNIASFLYASTSLRRKWSDESLNWCWVVKMIKKMILNRSCPLDQNGQAEMFCTK